MIRIDEAGYPVRIGAGLLDEADSLLPPGRLFLVSDENVAAAGWTDRLASAVGPRLIGSRTVPAGEASKSFGELERLLEAMLEARVERGDLVVAFGGGVVGDLAGFAASVLKRGCGFVQVPTSLLAQADAAIGGKTAINSRHGKNLIGAFHQPAAVLIDVAALATLPERELRAGYAEVVKYGLIGDAGFFAWCEANGAALLAGDEAARLRAVEASVRAKISYVADDERDTKGQRALLNFGHTFGHAVESLSGLPHGEAVAIGMAMAFRFSASLGLCPEADAKRVEGHLAAVGLPARCSCDAAQLLALMRHDKKSVDGRPRLILTRGIGRAFVRDDVPELDLAAFLGRDLA